MINILEVKKVLDEGEKITLTFEIHKDMVNSFTTLLSALTELNGDMRHKIRQASARQEARFEARKKIVKATHDQTKEAIRKTYLEHLDSLKNIKQAFKQTRKEHLLYNRLVREVRKEFRAKRELEIFRLHNLNEGAPNIAEKLHMSAGAVRKVIGEWKYHRPTPLEA